MQFFLFSVYITAVKKKKSNHSEETLELYDKLLASLPGVERKGVSMPFSSFEWKYVFVF